MQAQTVSSAIGANFDILPIRQHLSISRVEDKKNNWIGHETSFAVGT